MKKEGFDCTEILQDSIYLGSSKASKNINGLKDVKITHIVNIAGKQHFPNEFEYIRTHFEDSDESNILEKFDEIFKFIDEAIKKNGRVFIHCLGGVSRSPSIVIGYLIYKKNMNFIEAHEFVKNKRKGIKLKKEFIKQLEYFEKNQDS
eukprot:gene994-9900_t